MTSSPLFVGIARVNHLADRVLAIYSGHTLALSAMKRSYQRELIVGPARDQGNSVGIDTRRTVSDANVSRWSQYVAPMTDTSIEVACHCKNIQIWV